MTKHVALLALAPAPLGGVQTIHAFRVQSDGHLVPLGPVTGLPAGTRRLAAR